MTGFKRINITRYKFVFVFIISFLIFMFLYSKMVVVAAKNDYPYVIKVNRVHNTITVYEKDEKGEYSRPIDHVMFIGCKINSDLGTYQLWQVAQEAYEMFEFNIHQNWEYFISFGLLL